MKAIIALCALLASIPASAQQIHRWVDADGRVRYSDKPPPGVASRPVEARINSYSGTPVVSGAPSPAAKEGQPRPEIKMFATDWCPYCKKAQAFFAQQGIRYTHVDIEKSDAARAEYQRLGVSHMALEVSYSVYPAILETIDLLAEVVKPALDRG